MILWKSVIQKSFNDNMDISHLMVHSQQVEESRLKRKYREFKREKAHEGGTSKEKLEIQDKPKFKKRFSNQVSTKFHKASDDMVSNYRSKGERVIALIVERMTIK